MCSDFWFNSESVLTDARLPAALSVISPPLPVGAGLQYAHGAQGARGEGCKGVRLRRCKGVRLIYIGAQEI